MMETVTIIVDVCLLWTGTAGLAKLTLVTTRCRGPQGWLFGHSIITKEKGTGHSEIPLELHCEEAKCGHSHQPLC